MHQRSSFVAGLLAAASASPLSIRADDQTAIKSFKDIIPTADLQYVPCFENFTCANLEVPLDYENPEIGSTNVAFLRYESPKQPAMGDILFNPGGPGESGVWQMQILLESLVLLLGDSYNLVGMDPRGVNNSGPSLECFPGMPATRDASFIQRIVDFDPRSEVSMKKYYEETGAFGTWCSQTLNDTARYANTPATAHDMLHYAELLAKSQGKPCEEAVVNYYGASYGSVLGTTFASLYPHRVGRFIIDAVVDGEDYYFGNWSQNLLQADEAVNEFFDLCAEAGSDCALYHNGSTAEDIKQRVDAVLLSLEKDPLPVVDPMAVQFPTLITHMDLRTLILTSTYNPPVYFSLLAAQIASLELGNGSSTAVMSGKGIMPLSECDMASDEVDLAQTKTLLLCIDNSRRWEVTEESVKTLFEEERALSSYLGDVWARSSMPYCRNLPFVPPDSQVFQGYEKVKTSTPILFADNIVDPVTSSYEKMAAFYEGSVILKQDAIGHGLIVTTSNCTSRYVQDYLTTGTLPPPDTICESDFKTFVPVSE